MKRRYVNPRILFVLLIAMIFATAVYGFAAANTVPDSGAGDGAGEISGYTVSKIQYTLNEENPQILSQVMFAISADIEKVETGKVRVRLDADSSNWYDCKVADGQAICDLSTGEKFEVANADELRVVAVSAHTD